MDQDLGELFYTISAELTWVHWRWEQFRILFASKPSRIELLNECAPHFFYIVHRVLFEDALLGIARLVGPLKSSDKPNLTVRRFPSLIADSGLSDEVCELVQGAVKSAEFAVDWRNRRIAHRDLDSALNHSVRALEPATREKVDGALSRLRDVMNRIELALCGEFTAYSYGFTAGDAKALLYVIRAGLQQRRDRYERLKRREISPEDLNPEEAI